METSSKILNKLILIMISWIIIVSLILWDLHTTYDPFYLGRLSLLTPNFQADLSFFQDLPFTYLFNMELIKILNFEPIFNGYIPIVQILSLFSLILFGKYLYKDIDGRYTALYFIIPLVVFINVFLFTIPYQEYFIGYAMYPLFLGIFLKYTDKKEYNIAITLILIFITIHFFAIPMSTWIIQFLLIYFILDNLSKFKRFSLIENKGSISLTFVILLIVIWLFWNYKLLFALKTGTVDINTFYDVINDLIHSQSTGGFLSEFKYIGVNNNPITKSAGILYLILITIPILIYYVKEVLKKNILFFLNTKEDIFLFALIFPFIFEFIIYGSRGLLSFRYLGLIFPFIAYFYSIRLIKDDSFGKNKITKFIKSFDYKSINYYLITILICSTILINPQINQINPSLPLSNVNELSVWYSENIPNNSILVTDHKTESYLKYYLIQKNSKYGIIRDIFDADVYRYIINTKSVENNQNVNFDYLLIDKMHINNPISQGPPGWEKLTPLNYYITKIDNNENLKVIYDSGYVSIYQRAI